MADTGAPTPPKRFYKDASIVEGEAGWVLQLDGRPARTPGKNRLALSTAKLGEAVADEWRAQGETIDPTTMPLTRLSNSAIDGVAREMAEVRADILRYAGTDLVLYRAEDPQRLVAAQAAAWDPVLVFARDDLGATFVQASGIMHVAQPDHALARVGRRLETFASPFELAALHVLTTLSGSALLALMRAAGRITDGEAWAAAHADELYQESLWGADAEALRRRLRREEEFKAAGRMLDLARA